MHVTLYNIFRLASTGGGTFIYNQMYALGVRFCARQIILTTKKFVSRKMVFNASYATTYGDFNNSETLTVTQRIIPLYFDVIEVIISILGMIYNTGTCFALQFRRVKWNTRSKLICSLCVTDFLIAGSHFVQHVFGQTTPIYKLLNYSIAHYALEEPLWYFVQNIIYIYAQAVQQIIMLSLAVDLLIAVKRPIHYQRLMSTRRGTILISCSWIISFIIVFLQESVLFNSALMVLFLFVVPVLNFLALGMIYLIVFCEIREFNDRSPRAVDLRKSAVTFGIICVTYVLCMMPVSWVLALKFASKLSDSTLSYLYQVLKCLFVVNTVCDPLIYAWRQPDLKPVISKMFGSCVCHLRDVSRASRNVRTTDVTKATEGTEISQTAQI